MTSIADDFNRTENPLASGWSTSASWAGMRANGTVCYGAGDTDSASYWSSSTPGNDHYIEYKYPAFTGAGASSGGGVRHNTGGTSTFYFLEAYVGNVRLVEVTTGSHATLASQTDIISTTALYKLDATGTALTATKAGGNFTGGALSATDASIASGTWCMYGWNNSSAASNHWDIDDLAGNDGAGGANPKGPLGNPFFGPFGGPI